MCRLDEFSPTSTPPHLQIYTWPSCSLRELTHLLTSALPNLLPSPSAGTRVAFRLVFPDTRSTAANQSARYLSKELGSVVIGGRTMENGHSNGDKGLDALEGEAEKTLQDARFVIGDYVSVAIFPPLANGSVAPPPSSAPARGSYGGGRGSYEGRREDDGHGDGGFRVRGGGRAGPAGDFGRGGLPSGEWRRGERIPEGPGFRGGYGGGGRGRGRGGRGW